jgi:hypothetical protein
MLARPKRRRLFGVTFEIHHNFVERAPLHTAYRRRAHFDSENAVHVG